MYNETTQVNSIYSIIAHDFNRTRHKVWDSVKYFIEGFDDDTLFLEIGCGNGKNMLLCPNKFIGCDICPEFVKLCHSKHLNVVRSCMTYLPFRNNTFDATISVAVLHHLTTLERRQSAIEEQIRVTKPGGKLFIEVWGFENNNRAVSGQDTLVPWKYKEKTYNRYYHFFKRNELVKLCSMFKMIEIQSVTWEKFNWIIIMRKI